MAPKKDMMAVLEYWHGYLLLIFDCKINQEDQKMVPKTNAITPIVHFPFVLVEARFTDHNLTIWVLKGKIQNIAILYAVSSLFQAMMS